MALQTWHVTGTYVVGLYVSGNVSGLELDSECILFGIERVVRAFIAKFAMEEQEEEHKDSLGWYLHMDRGMDCVSWRLVACGFWISGFLELSIWDQS
mmetsp:Transcript_14990/g.26042  ORF Transcript_14990/g.26042 Transcript_14990/m.26042 type:complete len:97 (+) Transcript_14990:269-559(+)